MTLRGNNLQPAVDASRNLTRVDEPIQAPARTTP
jgi:hypothetical protein